MTKPLIVLALLAMVTLVLASLEWESDMIPGAEAATRLADAPASRQPALAGGDEESVRPAAPLTPERVEVDDARLPEGGVWMGIGDTFTFGAQVVPRRELAGKEFDFYLQDLRHDVSLECPHGAVPAVRPVSSLGGLPDTAASAAAILPDAPLYLPERNLTLTETPSLPVPGIGFVMAASGAVFRVHVEELRGHPDALRRRAFIRFEQVPQAERGGMMQLPMPDSSLAPKQDTAYLLSRAIMIDNAIPGSNFAGYLRGKDHTTVERLDTDMTVQGDHLIVKETLRSDVRVNDGSLFVERDVEAGATVNLLSGSALAVAGDIRGDVSNSGYGFMYVQGSLHGEMTHDSYATAIIEGDVTGTLHINSYSDVLIRGRLLGKLDVRGSCWSTVYLQSFTSRQQLMDMQAQEGDFHQITLHLASSDLLPGEHEDIGTWQTVIVSDPVWAQLIR